MKHIYLITLVLTLISCAKEKKHEKKHPINLPPLTAQAYKKLFSDKLSWNSLEKKVSDGIKIKWFKEYAPWAIAGGIEKGTLECLHALNLDGDKTDDFIYSGFGPVTYATVITINDNYYFNDSGKVSGIEFKNGQVSRIYFFEVLSTGGPSVDGYMIVDVIYNGTEPTFIERIECEQIYKIDLPNVFTDFSIESITDTIIARQEPVEIDTPNNYVLELPGNQFGKILKGTQAIVAGTKTDTLNTLWYLALIKPEFKIHNYPIPNLRDSVHRIVWVKANGWKKISP